MGFIAAKPVLFSLVDCGFLWYMISRYSALMAMRRKDHKGRFIPFSIRFVSCDSSRKCGGELVEYKNVTLPQRQIVELTQMQANKGGEKKKPSSYKSTVTFRTQDGEFKQCHVPLITRFNNEMVI